MTDDDATTARLAAILRAKLVEGIEDPELAAAVAAAKPKPRARFEIYKDRSGEFRFRLKSSNGEVLAVSEGFSTRDSVRAAIDETLRASREIIEDTD